MTLFLVDLIMCVRFITTINRRQGDTVVKSRTVCEFMAAPRIFNEILDRKEQTRNNAPLDQSSAPTKYLCGR